MDWTPWIPVAMILGAALAAHIKNLSQDSVIKNLQRQVAALQKRIDDCEKDRKRLNEMAKRGYDIPPA